MILKYKFKEAELDRLKTMGGRMDRLDRQRLCRTYVHYVTGEYASAFNNQHVLPDIMEFVAARLATEFPSLADPKSTPGGSPTFVSVPHTPLSI